GGGGVGSRHGRAVHRAARRRSACAVDARRGGFRRPPCDVPHLGPPRIARRAARPVATPGRRRVDFGEPRHRRDSLGWRDHGGSAPAAAAYAGGGRGAPPPPAPPPPRGGPPGGTSAPPP